MRKKRYNLFKIFIEVIKVSPSSFFIQYVFAAVTGILMGVFTIQIQKVFDNVHEFAVIGENLNELMVSILILATIKIIGEASSVVSNYFGGKYYRMSSKYFLNKYNLKHVKIEPIAYEDEKELNFFRKSLEGATIGRNQLHVIMDTFTLYVPYFLVISKYIFELKPMLLIIIVFMFIPVIATNKLKKKVYSDLEEEISKTVREKDEYFDYITKHEYIKETRTLGAFDYFKVLFNNVRELFNHHTISAMKKSFRIDCGSKLITMIGYLFAVILLIISVIKGEISIGAFGAVFTALDDIYLLLEELFIKRLGQYATSQPKLKSLIDFLNRREIEKEEEKELIFDEIRLKNLYFKYPNSNAFAIKNISFSIKKNEKIGIVGLNGSGKSTLSKILLGLYKADSGEICVDGEKHESHKYLAIPATSVFQKFNKYKISIKNNICLSESSKKYDNEEILDLIRKTGLEFEKKKLENGLDTICGKEFGGIDFSGGEWQRIAIARGLFRDRNFIILDEPTSAIDPVQEYEIYKLFEEICKDKTTIIITHRLMSIRFCDKIIVMQGGKIIDEGEHKVLIERCPYYKELWDSSTKGFAIQN